MGEIKPARHTQILFAYLRMSSDNLTEKAKDRILNDLRCGLSTYEEKKMPYSEADYFTYKFVSKALLVEHMGLEPMTS